MNKKLSTKELVLTGMLAAIAGVLMSLEVSLPMMPPFYKLDFSDVPSIIALFTMGPFSAVCVEVIKILIKLFTVGTNSMYVGEFANLMGVLLYVMPIWLIYSKGGKTQASAIAALAVNVPLRIVFSCFMNACITLPLYAQAMGVSLNEIVQSVSVANPLIKDLPTFLILGTIPFNLIKISANYAMGYALFKSLKAFNIVRKAA